MICGPTSKNEVRVWDALIQRRFQPKMHTRVSGVCLFAGGMTPVGGCYDWLVRASLIANPYSGTSLPDWIRNAIRSKSGHLEDTR